MDMKRKLELLEAWENRHPEMGVISFRCSVTDKMFLTTATDIPAKFNRIRFQFSARNCPNKRLQELWEQYGEDAFELQVMKRLEYDDPEEDHLGTGTETPGGHEAPEAQEHRKEYVFRASVLCRLRP